MTLEITHNEKESRFETEVENHSAFVLYSIEGKVISILSTVVPPAIGGQGIAALLTTHVLEYARTNKLTVVPVCSYTRVFIERNTQYLNLIKE